MIDKDMIISGLIEVLTDFYEDDFDNYKRDANGFEFMVANKKFLIKINVKEVDV